VKPDQGVSLAQLLPSFELSLADRGLSPKTIEVYQRTGTQLTGWLERKKISTGVEDISAPHLRAFLAEEITRTSPVSAHQHYRNLRVLFKWLIREEERKSADPMLRVDPPKVTMQVKPIMTDGQLTALLKTCEGQDFESRRDMAILRIMIDCGVRVSGIGNLQLDDVDLPRKTLTVTLKGGDQHYAPIGRKSAAALDRYLRARARRPAAPSPWLWLGLAGRDVGHFGAAGIQDMIERRGKEAGLGKLSPHWLRRGFAHSFLAAGGSEMDAARIAGWRGTQMVQHYAGELAGQRAREAHARLSPGDRL
jgi:site-specific recombinase XerD